MNTKRAIFILTTNNISSLDKGLKDRCVLVEMNAAKDSQYLPIARKVAADLNVVLNDTIEKARHCAGFIFLISWIMDLFH